MWRITNLSGQLSISLLSNEALLTNSSDRQNLSLRGEPAEPRIEPKTNGQGGKVLNTKPYGRRAVCEGRSASTRRVHSATLSPLSLFFQWISRSLSSKSKTVERISLLKTDSDSSWKIVLIAVFLNSGTFFSNRSSN